MSEKVKCYCICNKYFSNNIMFWRSEYSGYTTKIDEAGKYRPKEMWNKYSKEEFPLLDSVKLLKENSKFENFLIPVYMISEIGFNAMLRKEEYR